MASRYLFTRGRQILLIYISLSILATLTIFRFIGSFANRKKHIAVRDFVVSSSVPMPIVELNHDYNYGAIRDFESDPFLTEIECEGKSSYDRICRLKNICYSPVADQFFAVTVDSQGLAKKWKLDGDNRLLDLTSVDDHNIFYFEFIENPDFAYGEFKEHGMKYIQVTKKTFIFSRFVYNNIMHNIHDDFLGQYILHKKFSEKNGKIDTDNFMFFADRMLENENDHLLATLTKYPFIYREGMRTKKRDGPAMCFTDAIVGNSKEGIWYDYGFYDEPQGPVRKKDLSGSYIKEAAVFLKKYYKIDEIPRLKLEKAIKSLAKGRSVKHDDTCISIFSRTKDRLLLNELELKKELEETYGLPVKLVRLEELKFNEIVGIMSKSVISIGLHGAALIYTIFMPKNSIVIEMFPYAVPGENYSPYRTLAWLPEVEMSYRMWKNGDVKANFCQMGQRKNLHGITAQDYFNAISLKTVPPHVCCGNPYWLVRIYQDTAVNVSQIKMLIDDALQESLLSIKNPNRKGIQTFEYLRMSQGIVTEVEGFVTDQKKFTGNEQVQMRKVILNWKNPWNKLNLKPSQYGVWIDDYAEELITSEPLIVLETCPSGTEVNFWIRPYRYDKKSNLHIPAASFSRRFTFKC